MNEEKVMIQTLQTEVSRLNRELSIFNNKFDQILSIYNKKETNETIAKTAAPRISTQDPYEFFESKAIKADDLMTLMKSETKGMIFVLFYKSGCGPCASVLKEMMDGIDHKFFDTDAFYIVPRTEKAAPKLANLYRVTDYPTLAVVNHSNVIAKHVDKDIITFCKKVFK